VLTDELKTGSLGLSGQAIDNFERSVSATPADETRSQYLHRAYRLQAQADIGAWDAADQTIRQLIRLSREVGSTRTVVLLRDIPRQLAIRAKARVLPIPARRWNSVRLRRAAGRTLSVLMV
jgi:hypothetical protein